MIKKFSIFYLFITLMIARPSILILEIVFISFLFKIPDAGLDGDIS
jgi:hypothetical protein